MEISKERAKMERYTKALAKNEKWGGRFLVIFILLFFGSLSFPDLFVNSIFFLLFQFFLLLSMMYFEWWKGKNLREAQLDDNIQENL